VRLSHSFLVVVLSFDPFSSLPADHEIPLAWMGNPGRFLGWLLLSGSLPGRVDFFVNSRVGLFR